MRSFRRFITDTHVGSIIILGSTWAGRFLCGAPVAKSGRHLSVSASAVSFVYDTRAAYIPTDSKYFLQSYYSGKSHLQKEERR